MVIPGPPLANLCYRSRWRSGLPQVFPPTIKPSGWEEEPEWAAQLRKVESPGTTFLGQMRPNKTEQFLPRIPSPKPAISNNFGEIKQMNCHIPTRLLHLTVLCRSYSGPNVWKGSWLARVSFFFFLTYSAAAAK